MLLMMQLKDGSPKTSGVRTHALFREPELKSGALDRSAILTVYRNRRRCPRWCPRTLRTSGSRVARRGPAACCPWTAGSVPPPPPRLPPPTTTR
ncbi:hypothetical protein CDAR_102371 [Caerostris darwini]|uniref:Uncharacterized protein n=1 Tax=Caerostris darwini TaxID=1538125 RepID=A0AAV4TWP4_9ARAC|nr:hypothetical protein CDAR_102371 [Caerostris darwini]